MLARQSAQAQPVGSVITKLDSYERPGGMRIAAVHFGITTWAASFLQLRGDSRALENLYTAKSSAVVNIKIDSQLVIQ
jgi:hypothetical protein